MPRPIWSARIKWRSAVSGACSRVSSARSFTSVRGQRYGSPATQRAASYWWSSSVKRKRCASSTFCTNAFDSRRDSASGSTRRNAKRSSSSNIVRRFLTSCRGGDCDTDTLAARRRSRRRRSPNRCRPRCTSSSCVSERRSAPRAAARPLAGAASRPRAAGAILPARRLLHWRPARAAAGPLSRSAFTRMPARRQINCSSVTCCCNCFKIARM